MSKVIAFTIAMMLMSGTQAPWSDMDDYWSVLPVLRTPLYQTTAHFRERGVYDLGTHNGKKLVYRTDGPVAQDLLTVCGRVSHTSTYAGMICEEELESAGSANASSGESSSPDGSVYEAPAPNWQNISYLLVQDSKPGSLVAKVQPSRGWVYTGVDTILYLEGSPKSSETVEFAGTTAVITWSVSRNRIDFDDPSGRDSTVVAEDMGAPYPNESITWVYNTRGRATPRVVTTWDATVDVAGQKFVFDSARQTTSNAPSFEVRKPRVSLVSPGV